MLVFSSFTPFILPSFPDSFLTGLSAPNPIFGSAVPKKKRLQGTGEKVGSEVGCGHRKALEREPGRIFLQCNSYFPPNCQTPFSPSLFLRTSYLGSFPFLPPGSGVLGPESPLSKNVEIISPVKGRRTKIRFGGKSEEMAGCFDRSIWSWNPLQLATGKDDFVVVVK